MTEQHKHCPVCGNPIPLSEKVCSAQCQQVIAENQRKVRRTRMILYAAFAVFILIWLLYALKIL
jgi:predicted nucleic acid-binding Zn ribbon protein